MNFYNNNRGVILVCICFLLIMYFGGKYGCSCKEKTKGCYRTEILGVQYNHFYFFILLGIVFPSYFWTFQILGLLWELLEIILDSLSTTGYFGSVNIFPIMFKIRGT